MVKINKAKTEKRRSAKLIAAVTTAVLCIFTATVCVNSAAPVFANSGAPWEEGVTQSGVHSVHENSVLQVQSEKLIFKFDKPVYSTDETERYNSSVTAEYTFYNPTDETVNTTMAFPNRRKEYGYSDEKYIKPVDPITVNGEAVQYTVRHTYGTYNDFAEDVLKIKDDYLTTDFYKPDLPVTEYVFKTNIGDNNGHASFRAKMPQDDSNRYFCETDGDGYFTYNADNGYRFSIFVLGEDNGSLANLKWSATRYDYRVGRNMPIDGSVTFEKKTAPTTLKEYFLRTYDAKGDVSEMDWYNAAFERINKNGVYAGSGIVLRDYDFTEWYVYETTVAAKSTFTNAVTAIMYPRVYRNYDPDLYGYTYYLSPAQSWAAFGTLMVEVQTPMYMQGIVENPSDTNNKFIKTETGYRAEFSELPDGELEFSLSTAEKAVYKNNASDGFFAAGIVMLIAFIVAPLITGLTILTVFLVKRKKRRDAAAQQPVQQLTEEPVVPEGGTIEDAVGELTVTDPEEKKVYCTYCGKQISASSTFCPYCGGSTHGGAPVQPKPRQNLGPGFNNGVNDAPKKVNGLGIAGFVNSIVAWLFISIDVLTGFAFILAAVGFGLSLAGVILKKKYQKVYGLAIAGLAISSAMIAIIFVAIIYAILFFFGLLIFIP